MTDPERYIELSAVCGFNKMKKLGATEKVLVDCCANKTYDDQSFEFNQDRTKIRKKGLVILSALQKTTKVPDNSNSNDNATKQDQKTASDDA